MTGELGYSLPPAIRRISANFRMAGWGSLWAQAIIGVISTLLFVIDALESDTRFSNPGSGLFAALGLLTVFVSVFWNFRYVLLGRKLRKSDPDSRPKPKDAARVVRIGTLIAMIGMLFTILGGSAVVGSLWLRSLRQLSTSGVVLQDNSAFINAADIAVVFSVVNTMVAHYIGLCVSLWLQYVVDRQ
jgi:ABC-type Fe3+ transport system permease subunit